MTLAQKNLLRRQRFAEYTRLAGVQNGIVPVSVAAWLLDVGRTRLCFLPSSGRVQTVPLFGGRFVLVSSLREYSMSSKRRFRRKLPSKLAIQPIAK